MSRNYQTGSIRDKPANTSNLFHLRKGVRDFAVMVISLNIINIVLYNTGWIDWRNDTFDTIWATGLCVLDISVVAMFQLLDR